MSKVRLGAWKRHIHADWSEPSESFRRMQISQRANDCKPSIARTQISRLPSVRFPRCVVCYRLWYGVYLTIGIRTPDLSFTCCLVYVFIKIIQRQVSTRWLWALDFSCSWNSLYTRILSEILQWWTITRTLNIAIKCNLSSSRTGIAGLLSVLLEDEENQVMFCSGGGISTPRRWSCSLPITMGWMMLLAVGLIMGLIPASMAQGT